MDDDTKLTPMQRYYRALRQGKEPDGWIPIQMLGVDPRPDDMTHQRFN